MVKASDFPVLLLCDSGRNVAVVRRLKFDTMDDVKPAENAGLTDKGHWVERSWT